MYGLQVRKLDYEKFSFNNEMACEWDLQNLVK